MNPHPLDNLWLPFEPASDRDVMDVTLRSLRGMVFVHRPVTIRPVLWRLAKAFLGHVHRHNRELQGWMYGVSAWDTVGMIALATVGRPVCKVLDDGNALEITRLAIMDNAPPNVGSLLLGRACRMAAAQGRSKLISYTLEAEDGTCFKAAGFVPVACTEGGEWSRKTRPREEADFDTGPKIRWERGL